MTQVAVLAKIPAAPGKREELIAALQAALETARGESGTIYYILHTDAKDADALYMYELYENQDAFTAHVSSDAFKALGPTIGHLLGGAPEMTFLGPVGGKGL
jgi:quinol monooxygenase YgiN